MTVIRASREELSPANRPPWCTVSSAGVFRIAADAARFDCHYHDCHEYWLISRGRARIRIDGHDAFILPGDIVAIRAGLDHDILEIYEDIEAFWFEEALPPGGRPGHLHRDAQAAAGHAVPHTPLPPDFPT